VVCVFLGVSTFALDLHENFNASFYVIKDCKAVKLKKTFTLFLELLLTKAINLIVRADLHLQVEINYGLVQNIASR
jgi:hypothetical protein